MFINVTNSKIKIINPHKTLGIVTLWSSVDYIERLIVQNGINLHDHFCAIGTLYGNGLREILRNMLFNQHVDIIALGRNRNGSWDDLFIF